MTNEVLQATIDAVNWEPLGEGTYNRVFISKQRFTINGVTGLWVLKCPRGKKYNYLNTPERAVRKWNIINPNYPAIALNGAWLAPYLGNTPASDEHISFKLIEIYRRTRCIVADAAAKGNNFLVYDNQVVCVDVDQAFQRGSVASDKFDVTNHTDYCVFLNECSEAGFQKTISVIKTLFYLEYCLAVEAIQDHYITPELIAKLQAFCYAQIKITVEILDTLLVCIDNTYQSKHQDALALAIYHGYDTTAKLLLDAGVRISQAVSELFEFFCFSARNGYLARVMVCLERHPEWLNKTDELNQTALLWAASRGCHDVVRFLIAKGAHVNIVTKHPQQPKDNNASPLDWAIRSQDTPTILALVRAGAETKISQKPELIAARTRHSMFSSGAGHLTVVKRHHQP